MSKNEYRKPEIGAWNYFKSGNNVTYAFFCGDALGRHGDWNNSDLEFAENAGIEIQEPEKLFPPVEIQISDAQTADGCIHRNAWLWKKHILS